MTTKMSKHLLSVYFVSDSILNPLQFADEETGTQRLVSEITQPVSTILCSTNGSLHAYPASGPEPGSEATTERNEALPSWSSWSGRIADGRVNSES